MQLPLKKITYWALVLASQWLASTNAIAEVVGDPALLRQIAEVHTANVEKITTWSGRVEIHDRTELDGQEVSQKDNEVVFFANIPTHQLRFDWITNSLSGEQVPNPIIRKNGLVTNDRYISVARHQDPSKLTPRILIEPSNKLRVGPMTQAFDPRFAYTYPDEDLAKHFLWIADHADNPESSVYVVTRLDDVVTVRIDINGIFNEWVVDLAKGATLVSYRAADKWGDNSFECTTKCIDGVWIPSEWKYTNRGRWRAESNVRVPSKEVRLLTRTVRWVENNVNQSIAPDQFSIDRLGINDGDLVVNRLTHTDFHFSPDQAHQFLYEQ